MDLGKILAFKKVLPLSVQEDFLSSCQKASFFFCDATDRAKYGGLWSEIEGDVSRISEMLRLPCATTLPTGDYFEPLTYLVRYQDVRSRLVNPTVHYERYWRHEGRQPF